ncbi:hypothetical protein BCR39DRAFT_588706 [Naematelia encephala]|uniref:Galactose oxidase n=1 Tax=Naematelia encephala TaxID=71784 RepID=A0A1Y2B1W0_9TREE|nr:hypothetical protein BCR39DRAFT_588706 [Naematelia encephala]
MMRGVLLRCLVALLSAVEIVRADESYTMIPRWGHASTYLPSNHTLLIQGGKTDPTSLYTYTSAPNSPDVILLDLSSSFDNSSPPWTLSSNPGPTDAWHTISMTSNSSGLLFGGDGGSTEAVQTLSDSSWLLSVDSAGTVNLSRQDTGWAAQPMRRIYHSAVQSEDGSVSYIIGGMKDDGSEEVFDEVYAFSTAIPSFATFTSLPQGLYHHASVMLPNGTIVVFGGVFTSSSTGGPALLPLGTLYAIDTTATNPGWSTLTLGGSAPNGRRGATAVLDQAGEKVFLFGGGDVALSTAFGDLWVLDLETFVWQEISAGDGPSARFDYCLVPVGGDQVIVFGGHTGTSPADPNVYVLDTAIGSWKNSFNMVSSGISATTGQSGEASKTANGGTTSAVAGTSDSMTQEGGAQAPSTSKSPPMKTTQSQTITHPASPSETLGDAGGNSHPLPTGSIIGLSVGLAACPVLLAIFLWFRHRRLRRKKAALAAMWGSPPGPTRSTSVSRPYGSREKGGKGLLEPKDPNIYRDLETPDISKSPLGIGLGMGAIGTSLASMARRLGPQPQSDPYAPLHDPGEGLAREPTRRAGDRIRLVGPRAASVTKKYAPVRLGEPLARSSVSAARFNILSDEDSRRFTPSKEEDWRLPSETDGNDWRSARSLLREEGSEGDPFDDDDSLRPPVRGGPVPTPHDSRSDLDTYDRFADRTIGESSRTDYRLPEVSPSDPMELNGLLPLLSQLNHPGAAISRSARSRQSSSTEDLEEGTLHHAHIISPSTAQASLIQHAQRAVSRSATILSTATTEGAYVPIKRSESFFKRMTQGLLSRQPTGPRPLEIRDPSPAPALWPEEEVTVSHPPPSFARSSGQLRGPSESSLASAQSMRGMAIIQREMTNSTMGTIAAVDEAETSLLEDGDENNNTILSGHHRHGLTGISEPGSVVFNGAEFSSPTSAPVSENQTPPRPPSTSAHNKTPPRPSSTSAPPSGSPVPKPLVSHRRPVREVVNSINKRASTTPLSLLSPSSQYSPQRSSPRRMGEITGDTRPSKSTLYEAVKRGTLLVANPDKDRDRSASGSS